MQTAALASLSRTTILAVVVAFLMTSASLPVQGQSSVPASAVEAAKLPRYATRLAPPASRSTSRPNPVRPGSRTGPPQDPPIYENGPIQGTTDAWTIGFGYVTGNSFTIANSGSIVTGMNFGVWLIPGDTLEAVELSITSSENGGTSFFDQTVSFTQNNCVSNQYGFNVCTASASFTGPTLNSGTYWVNLQNASVASGDPAYWDENAGAGCQSEGCPSQAYQSSVGTIPFGIVLRREGRCV